jgi:hypothetical protein
MLIYMESLIESLITPAGPRHTVGCQASETTTMHDVQTLIDDPPPHHVKRLRCTYHDMVNRKLHVFDLKG